MSKLHQQEKSLVCELALQVAEIANSETNRQIIKRWSDVNALRRPDRAPVWCRPMGCLEELIPQDTLVCKDSWLRSLEYYFRQILCKYEIGDDSPVEPYFDVQAVFDIDPPNRWGVEVGKHISDEKGGAWSYDPQLKSKADFKKLKMPSFTYNESKSLEQFDKLGELLGDILPVKLVCNPVGNATLGMPAADLRGLEQIMMDMIAGPELMHKLMAYILDVRQRELDVIESSGLFIPNRYAPPVLCSNQIGPEVENGKYTFKNSWCMGNSQEFDQVSPAMWEEFCLQYQKPIFERFGYICYGCCENLTHKIDGVLSIPNLRIFVCSAWTDMNVVLEKINKDYCIMWRQKASNVVFPDDINEIRTDLEEGIKRLQGQYYQIVLQELQTLAGHPDRLHIWTDIAKELAVKYS